MGVILGACRARRLPTGVRGLGFLVIGLLLVLPVKGLPIAGYIRGITGDISITTLFVAGVATICQLTNRDFWRSGDLTFLMILVLSAGALLYPFALGLTRFDPYALGYGSRALAAGLLFIALIAWYVGNYLVLLCTGLAVTAYLMGLYESPNLWDYLVDPGITLYAIFYLAINGGKHLYSRKAVSDEKHELH
jgi:hypothetical protein